MSAPRRRRLPRGAVLVVGTSAVVVTVMVLVRSVLGGGSGADDPAAVSPVPSPTVTAGATPSTPAPSPSPTLDAALAEQLVSAPAVAAAARPEDLLSAGLVLGRGPWRGLASPAWPMRTERPVYVGRATIQDGRIDADVVIAHRLGTATDELVLRLLPAAVGDNGLRVDVSIGGEPAEAEADPGGLLRITLPERHDVGRAVTVRVELGYDVLTATAAPDDGGPAAYGILAASPGVMALGHWLPLLTFEPEPIVPWGDVGSFPPAVWSLQVTHGGRLVTGGDESGCPAPSDATCTWSRGLALRDVSAVLFEEAASVESVAAGLTIRAIGGPAIGEASLETVVRESVASAEGFTRRFGAVAWRELDVVAVPLGQGAAGVEFPGIVMIDDELYDALGGGFGTYVVVHEVAHQWFHALVGNGSFADPVVDEPLAQYLSVLAYRDLFGPVAAEALVDDAIAGRYRRFRSSGLAEEPPAQASSGFVGPGTYGPLVYARAPLAWLAAEDVVGPDGVASFLARLVDIYGLGTLSAEQLVADAEALDEEFADVLRRYWYGDAPVPVP